MSILLQTLSNAFSPAQRAKRRAFQQLQDGELASAVLTCDKILRSDPKDTVALRVLADVSDEVAAKVEQFQSTPDAECERGLRKNLPYAGEVTPAEAHRLFTSAGARIVDVRSRFEHEHIGRVPGTPLIVWKHWPGGEFNRHFLPELQRHCSTGDIVLFLCRSGIRSHSAAAVAAEAGFTQAFNVLEGFEGDLNKDSQRGHLGGWRMAGLPWIQS